jgi:hypothetical protein
MTVRDRLFDACRRTCQSDIQVLGGAIDRSAMYRVAPSPGGGSR